jgi:predicted CXXCH cytochrome family protein
MTTAPRVLVAGALAGALAASVARAAPEPIPNPLAPIADAEAVSKHAPYEMGACETCHGPAGAKAPGAVRARGDALCFECHDEFKKAVRGHPAERRGCTRCHSPHNSTRKHLLL